MPIRGLILCTGARSSMSNAFVAVAEGMRSERLCTDGMYPYFDVFALRVHSIVDMHL